VENEDDNSSIPMGIPMGNTEDVVEPSKAEQPGAAKVAELPKEPRGASEPPVVAAGLFQLLGAPKSQLLRSTLKSTDLSWEGTGSGAAAGGESHNAEHDPVVPPPQDETEGDDRVEPSPQDEVIEEVTTTETIAVIGLSQLWSKVVESIIVAYAAAPEPRNNPLADIEAEIAEAVVPDLEADMAPRREGAPTPAPVRHEDAWMVLETSPEGRVVIREMDIEDPTPLRSTVMEDEVGSSSHAADEVLALVDDTMLDAEHVAI